MKYIFFEEQYIFAAMHTVLSHLKCAKGASKL